jgi:hypothetical protein
LDVTEPVTLYRLADPRWLLGCGAAGLTIVPIDGSHATLLDRTSCQPAGLDNGSVPPASLPFLDGAAVYYAGGSELRRVPLDGSALPERVGIAPLPQIVGSTGPYAEIVAIGGRREVYTTVRRGTFAYDARDGWIDGWRFMERGRLPTLSLAGDRVFFIEHAADDAGAGDFSTAAIGGPIERLARNVNDFDLLEDGRILAASNQAFAGTHNRVIAIDPERRQARWVVGEGAKKYTRIPNTDDLLVELITPTKDTELVRVVVPPR